MYTKKNILLFGAGQRCDNLCKILSRLSSTIDIIAIVDNDPQKWGTKINNIIVENPKALGNYRGHNFCITIGDLNIIKSIRKELTGKYFYKIEDEVMYMELIRTIYKDNDEIVKISLTRNCNQFVSKNIIFDCYNGLVLGGIESWTVDLCENLVLNGIKNIAILSYKGSYQVPLNLQNMIDQVEIDHKAILEKETFSNVFNYILSKLPCVLVTSQPSVILLAASIIKDFHPNKIKIISVIHNGTENSYEQYSVFRKWVDTFVAVSHDIKEGMIALRVKPEKVLTMTCPFACEEKLNRTYTENVDWPVHIGYAGRLDGMEHSQKRMDLILKLVAELAHRNIPFQLQIAGDGIAREQMEEFLKKHGLEQYVQFLGRLKRSDIPAFWQRQDIGINLSDYEGRSISQLEAMANGVVLVVTDTSGVRDDITDGVNGYIVHLGDYMAAADKIEYLASHRERLRTMGEQAHAEVFPKSSMDQHVAFWMNCLQ